MNINDIALLMIQEKAANRMANHSPKSSSWSWINKQKPSIPHRSKIIPARISTLQWFATWSCCINPRRVAPNHRRRSKWCCTTGRYHPARTIKDNGGMFSAFSSLRTSQLPLACVPRWSHWWVVPFFVGFLVRDFFQCILATKCSVVLERSQSVRCFIEIYMVNLEIIQFPFLLLSLTFVT